MQTFNNTDNSKQKNEFRLNICNEIAERMVYTFCDFNNTENHTRKHFEREKKNIQDIINKKLNHSNDTQLVNIIDIGINDRIGNRTLIEWIQNISKIEYENKIDAAINKFKTAFCEIYLNKIFKSKK